MKKKHHNKDYMRTSFEEYAEEILVDTETGEKKVINNDPFSKENVNDEQPFTNSETIITNEE